MTKTLVYLNGYRASMQKMKNIPQIKNFFCVLFLAYQSIISPVFAKSTFELYDCQACSNLGCAPFNGFTRMIILESSVVLQGQNAMTLPVDSGEKCKINYGNSASFRCIRENESVKSQVIFEGKGSLRITTKSKYGQQILTCGTLEHNRPN